MAVGAQDRQSYVAPNASCSRIVIEVWSLEVKRLKSGQVCASRVMQLAVHVR